MAKLNIKPRVRVPGKIRKGEAFEVKTLVTHKMETGLRRDKTSGDTIAREILNKLRVTYNGKEVLLADWHPAVSANPYTSFYVVAEDSGQMEFTWTADNGDSYSKTIEIQVSQ